MKPLIKIMNVLAFTMTIIFMVSICYGESAKEAVRALQKLQARVEAGISYRDYRPALGDALFEVKLFLSSPESKEKIELATAISKAMYYYQFAADLRESSRGESVIGVNIALEKAGYELQKAIDLLSQG
ncbi:MAG: hypothetical protein ABSB22_01280 [Thermodesulfobacteriota bacterium]|jgi:hypothetical protein